MHATRASRTRIDGARGWGASLCSRPLRPHSRRLLPRHKLTGEKQPRGFAPDPPQGLASAESNRTEGCVRTWIPRGPQPRIDQLRARASRRRTRRRRGFRTRYEPSELCPSPARARLGWCAKHSMRSRTATQVLELTHFSGLTQVEIASASACRWHREGAHEARTGKARTTPTWVWRRVGLASAFLPAMPAHRTYSSSTW